MADKVVGASAIHHAKGADEAIKDIITSLQKHVEVAKDVLNDKAGKGEDSAASADKRKELYKPSDDN